MRRRRRRDLRVACAEFVETIDAARSIVKKAYLYTNNHFSAKSVANAVEIKRQLGEPISGDYPEAFVAAYPALAGAVKVRAPEDTLFESHPRPAAAAARRSRR